MKSFTEQKLIKLRAIHLLSSDLTFFILSAILFSVLLVALKFITFSEGFLLSLFFTIPLYFLATKIIKYNVELDELKHKLNSKSDYTNKG